jgi:GH15 family glucan-1,4-alpha-glucosidase
MAPQDRPSTGPTTPATGDEDGAASNRHPVDDHGMIGDLRTAALVSGAGSIDWFCCPRFDSPSVFGGLLDPDGGHWSIRPVGSTRSRQLYMPDSNVLVTRFMDDAGVVEVQDFMPLLRAHDPDHVQRIVRRVVAVRRTADMVMALHPRFDYGRAEHRVERDGDAVVWRTDELVLRLEGSVAVELDDRGDVAARFSLGPGEEAHLVLEVGGEAGGRGSPDGALELLRGTVAFWQRWIGGSTYRGRWRDTVNRSALTLKMLTHEPSGAIIAAPTASLPEEMGGERNWDYRYVWIRDAAFSLYALLRLGFTDEAGAFMRWLTDRFADGDDFEEGPLRVCYTIDGESTCGEVELDHWAGHGGSRPVRIRNDAGRQLQLDIYGELIDSIYLFDKHGAGISHDSWTDLLRLVDWLREHWDQDDEGIWEVRAPRQPHTFSRLMCWVAMERTMRIARRRGLPGDITTWAATRDEIYACIMDEGWNEERGAFVQTLGGEQLDASLLLLPMVKFVSPTDPRFLSTLEAVERTLVTDALVFRYDQDRDVDGIEGVEGTFTMCSFWHVEALTRVGQLAEARLALEKMFTYANPVGLYAEEIGVAGQALGNFPQAFTHLGLISAAINLDLALGP